MTAEYRYSKMFFFSKQLSQKLNNSCLLASFYQKAEYTTRLTMKTKTRESRQKSHN